MGDADCVKCLSVLVTTSSQLSLLGCLGCAKPCGILEGLIGVAFTGFVACGILGCICKQGGVCAYVGTLCVPQAIRIIRAVLEKYGTYESFEVATGGRLLSKCQIWSVIRKYMQKEGCVGEVIHIPALSPVKHSKMFIF